MTASLTPIERGSGALFLSILFHLSFIGFIPALQVSTRSMAVPIEIQVITLGKPPTEQPQGVTLTPSPTLLKQDAIPKDNAPAPASEKIQEMMLPPLVMLPIDESVEDILQLDPMISEQTSSPGFKDLLSLGGIGRVGSLPVFTPLIKVTKMPAFKEQAVPTYPVLAKRFEQEGTVIVEVSITETGHVLETKIVQGLGFGFDEAAQEAIAKSLFTPAYVGDQAVAVIVRIPMKFRFKN